jgi:hypothetical protein
MLEEMVGKLIIVIEPINHALIFPTVDARGTKL